jgi:hypothetical protein
MLKNRKVSKQAFPEPSVAMGGVRSTSRASQGWLALDLWRDAGAISAKGRRPSVHGRIYSVFWKGLLAYGHPELACRESNVTVNPVFVELR